MKTLLQVITRHDEGLKSFYLLTISKFAAIALSIFALLNIAYNHNYLLAGIEILYISMFILVIIAIKKIKDLAHYMVTYLLVSIISIAIYMTPSANLTFMWSLLVPISSIFLLGLQDGKKVSSLFFIYLLGIFIFIKVDNINMVLHLNVLISYIVIGAVAYIYELYNIEYNKINTEFIANLNQKKESLENFAVRDELTNLYNKIKIDKMFDHEFLMYKRYKISFSLMLIDIDKFKYVNQTYGHKEGDKVLQEFAKILQHNFRDIDCIGRWGGKEFLVVLPNTTIEDASILAQRLCDLVQKHTFNVSFSNTCSVGVTSIIEGDTHKSIFARVEKLLYTVKENGRNGFLHY